MPAPWLAFDEIRVSDVTVSGRRMTATLSATPAKTSRATPVSVELRQVYPEPLAAGDEEFLRMAVASVALNYGLVARRIRFDFPLDPTDIVFLEWANRENARDTFVNKFVADLGMLREEVRPRGRKDAALVAPAKIIAQRRRGSTRFPFVDGHAAILSSGGKESLCSYALLPHVGLTPHPWYMTESGGHWRTALAAYRYHAQNDAKTRRVWTNVDRVYVALEKASGLVRPEAWKKRFDDYPVRLYTFHHYVLSLLPLARRAGVGHVMLGNEFDEPLPAKTWGVPHHFGAFDQMEIFDRKATAYFARRGWGVKQWSPVRPITGLAVQAVLTRLGPDLLPVQRSCHSTIATKTGTRPCGKCRKDHSLLLYLDALGIAPKTLRFPATAHVHMMKHRATARFGLDETEEEHARWMATRRGVPLGGRRQSHVLSWRRHPRGAPPDFAPAKYRKPLRTAVEGALRGW